MAVIPSLTLDNLSLDSSDTKIDDIQIFGVNVSEVQRRTPVATEEELCEKMSLENIDALTAQIKTSISAEAEQKANADLKSTALETIVEKTGDFPIPPTTLAKL